MKVRPVSFEEVGILLSGGSEGVGVDPKAEVYGIEHEGSLVAIGGILFNSSSTARLKMAFTHPSFRGRGALTRLLSYRLAVCTNRGIKKVRACCLAPSLGVYLKHGFVVTRRHNTGTDVLLEL